MGDVTILGAGIVGICCALSLIERGHTVTLVDKGAPGQATSAGNAGIISPWSVIPQSMPGMWKKVPGWLLDPEGPLTVKPSYLPRLAPWGLKFLREGHPNRISAISDAMDLLNRDCIALFRRHLSGTDQDHLIVDSYYIHAFRDSAAANADAVDYQMRRDRGAKIEKIGADALRAIEPHLTSEFEAAILIKGQARAQSPGRIGTVLAEKFQQLGGTILRETIRGIRPDSDGSWIYTTDQTSRIATKLVIAMGVWSAELLRPLGLKIPMEAERGYHISFTDPGVELNHSVMDMDMKFVASSMTEGLRVAGTAEFAGLDAPENPKRLEGLVALARALLPDLNDNTITTWSGQRPSLPDSLPCIGNIEGFPGLIAAFGHSHYGLMMAPKTGELVADLLSGVHQNHDLSPFTPTRYQGKFI